MRLFGFTESSPQTADSRAIVARYKRLRPIRRRLNDTLVSRLSRDVLMEGAKRIGILHRGTIVLENEDQSTVLMDYCIYNIYRKGRNAIEQYLCDCPPDPDSEEMACLQAMQHATYTMLAVLHVERGVGCQVRDLFTDETRLLIDMGLSKTAKPGAVMATRLLDFGDFVATGGAALPLGILDEDELDEWQRNLRKGVHVDRFDPAPLIRECLRQGASSNVRYEGAQTLSRSGSGGVLPRGEILSKRKREPPGHQAKKPLANRRCRCGSGKMVKNCCGKR